MDTMLRKRTRSNLKDHQIVATDDGLSESESDFFNAPLCVGLNSKTPEESDSARSPTSPLDFHMLSNLRNPFRSPRSSQRGNQKFWFSNNKVGLGIIDSPDFDTEHSGGVIFGIRTLNLQTQRDNSEVMFEIGDSRRSESTCLGNSLIGNISPSEIELSEDYTCIRRIHGPNPKVTHIFCDCILECHDNDFTRFGKAKEHDNLITPVRQISKASSHSASDFLKFCSWCNKNLDGEDIYMYRGEKAFCSCDCRLQEILIDEEKNKIDEDNCEDSAKPSSLKDSSESGDYIQAVGTVYFCF